MSSSPLRISLTSPTVSQSTCSLVHFEEQDEDEYLAAENESLQQRVIELEKIVAVQQNDILLLQSTAADLIRKFARFEEATPTRNHVVSSSPRPRLPSSRSASQSSYCLAASSHSPVRNTLSRSLYVSREQETPTSGRGDSSRTRKASQGLVNVSVGKSVRGSPMRKWLSHLDVGGGESRGKSQRMVGGERGVSGSPSPSSIANTMQRSISHRGSVSSLVSMRSLHRLRENAKEPEFSPATGMLDLNIGGRSVSVPVPSAYPSLDPCETQAAPESTPQLEWVYGYRGKDVRHNLHYLPTGELIYFSGNIVVMFNREEGTQRHYTPHTSDVRSLAVHPNRHIVASGQSTRHSPEKGGQEHRSIVTSSQHLEKQLEMEHTDAHIRIWDSVTLSTLSIIGSSSFEKAVVALSFSLTDGGTHLSAVDDSYTHNLSVWNWTTRQKVAESKGANDVIFGCLFHPSLPNRLILYGKGHLAFWSLETKSGQLTKVPAVFEGRDKPKSVLCVCFTENGLVAAGDSNGTISLWDQLSGKTVKQAHSVHPGGVFALSLSRKGHLVSAGKDRMVAEWQAEDLVRRRRPVELPDDCGLPRCIVFCEGDSIVVGTSTNTLFIAEGEKNYTDLIQGDIDDIISVCSHGSAPLLIAASRDGGIRIWNTDTHQVEWYKHYGESIECISLDSTGAYLAIGYTAGTWCVVDMSTKETLLEQRESSQPITAIRFAPLGNTLVVATKDLLCHLYRVEARRCVRTARLGPFTSWVVSIDWDAEAAFVRVNTAVGHLHHFTSSGESLGTVGISSVRDVIWHDSSCRISFEAGLATHSNNGVAVIGSSDGMLAIGKENGEIRLMKNPVTSVVAGHHSMRVHGFAVSSLSFHRNRLVSAGLSDCSLFQWKLTK